MNIEKLDDIIASDHDNICGVVVVKNEKMVLERYYNGFKSDDAVNIMSVTKSIFSLLVGIAIDKGYIKSVSQKVLEFFPDYNIKHGEKTIQNVTLKNLLTMTAPYKYKSEPWTKICTSKDWTKAALDILGGKSGVTEELKYSTLGIQILAGIIQNSSKMSIMDFATKYLFDPLEIPKHKNADVFDKQSQFDFLMSKSPKGNVWMADPQGVNTAGWGLCLSAIDMAKIGEVYANNGVHNGKQIVSLDWIKESTTPYVKCDYRFACMSYGYLWWIIDSGIYAAIGDGGNVIYVNNNQNIVVSITANFKPRVYNQIRLIQDYIEPLVQSIQTL